MPEYSKSKIYTIRCITNENLIYVGSTTETRLSARFSKHKHQHCCSLYKYIEENNMSWDSFYIELYEEFPCENREQLLKREGEVIRQISTINKLIPRTEERKKEDDKKYRETHKEQIAEKDKIYRANNKEKLLAKKAEYNEKNKEYKSNYMRERYTKKKEELIEKEKERRMKPENKIKINCECGSCIFKYKLRDHIKTQKHQEYLKSLDISPSP